MDLQSTIRPDPRPLSVWLDNGLAQTGRANFRVSSPLPSHALFPLRSKVTVPFQSHIKPGGWCEFKDWDVTLKSPDNSLPKDSYVLKYHEMLYEAVGKIGRDYKPGVSLKKWVEEAAFVNVTEEVLSVPIGMWAKDRKYVSLSLSLLLARTKIDGNDRKKLGHGIILVCGRDSRLRVSDSTLLYWAGR